jgi:hypothetical protein
MTAERISPEGRKRLDPTLLESAAQPRVAKASSVVFVDVAEQGTKAQITRAGAPLAEIQVRPEVISSYLDSLDIVAARVVSQSIAPGTAVPRGTVVNVTLARVGTLPIEAIAEVHPALTEFTVASATEAFLTPEVKDILRRRTDPDDLTTSEKATVTAALQTRNISVTDEGPTSLKNAYTGLQAAFQFGS